MSEVDRIFNEIRKSGVPEDGHTAFERRVVRRILSRTGQAIEGCETFTEFYTRYPLFPLRLAASKLPFTHKASLADMFSPSRLKKLPWYQAFTELASQDGECDCLVFSVPHSQQSLMVVHELSAVYAEYDPELSEARLPKLVMPVPRGPGFLVLQPLDGLLQDTGSAWVA